MFNGCGCDQGIWETQSELSRHSTCSFGHCTVDEELAKRSKHFGRQGRRCVASEEFGSSDDRVVQSVTTRLQRSGATEVVDEDVGVDKKVRFDPAFNG